MTRIEMCQVNAGALISIGSTLNKLQSDNVVEIVNEGKGIVLRKKHPDEKVSLGIDLKFWDEIFAKAMKSQRPMEFTGEAESYIRNLSYACQYYRQELNEDDAYNHFDIFHHVHFVNVPKESIEEDIILQMCQLFRIPIDVCEPYLKGDKNIAIMTPLPPKHTFNEYFGTVIIDSTDKKAKIIFESRGLKYMETYDAVLAIKDLLFARGVDLSPMPYSGFYAIQPDSTESYNFRTVNGHILTLTITQTKVTFSAEQELFA